jgi:hypothetical protein
MTSDEFIKKTQVEVDRLKTNGRKYHYLFSQMFGDGDGLQIVRDLEAYAISEGWTVEIRWCNNCSVPRCDIIIGW